MYDILIGLFNSAENIVATLIAGGFLTSPLVIKIFNYFKRKKNGGQTHDKLDRIEEKLDSLERRVGRLERKELVVKPSKSTISKLKAGDTVTIKKA